MTLLNLNLGHLFTPDTAIAETIIRGTVMYWFLFLVLRFVLRRDVGSPGIMDFLFVVLLGDAAQNAMIGEGMSPTDGMILIATLVAWNYTLDYLAYQFPKIDRIISARRICLIKDGKKNFRNIRREFITHEELGSKIHQEGLENISQVKRMWLESNGEITVIKMNNVR